MSLPSTVGLPNEMMLGHLDYSLPSDAKSYSVKIQPSNISQIVSPTYSTGATANAVLDLSFPAQNLIFDIPCGGSPSQFLDTRFTTLNYRMNIAVVGAAGNVSTMTSGYLRSSGNAFFDRLYCTSQSGQIVEDIANYNLVNDTLLALQMSIANYNSIRDGVASQYGFLSSTAIESQGHAIGIFGGRQLVTGDSESHSYSLPPLSSVVGVIAD